MISFSHKRDLLRDRGRGNKRMSTLRQVRFTSDSKAGAFAVLACTWCSRECLPQRCRKPGAFGYTGLPLTVAPPENAEFPDSWSRRSASMSPDANGLQPTHSIESRGLARLRPVRAVQAPTGTEARRCVSHPVVGPPIHDPHGWRADCFAAGWAPRTADGHKVCSARPSSAKISWADPPPNRCQRRMNSIMACS